MEFNKFMVEKFKARWPNAGIDEVQVIGDLPPFSASDIESDKLKLAFDLVSDSKLRQLWSYSKSREITVWLYGPSLKVREVKLKMCKYGHLEIMSGWRHVVKEEKFEVGEMVTLWYLKDSRRPSHVVLAMHYKAKNFMEGAATCSQDD